ncbi:MAG: hypothetical protein ABEI86_12550, partial [Halobacteriaceae archaeon]
DKLEEADQDDPEIEIGNTKSARHRTPFESLEDLWDNLRNKPQRMKYVRDDVFFHGHPVHSREIQLGFEIGSLLRILRPDDWCCLKAV